MTPGTRSLEGAAPRPAAFVDRDGTLVRDVRHGADPAAISLLPGAGLALHALQRAGYVLAVVTNQSGVARGLFSVGEAIAMARRIAALLQPHDARLNGYFMCPHHADGALPEYALSCRCRKPEPGLLVWAAERLQLDLGHSWMIGDTWHDIAAGRAVGARTALVDIGCRKFTDGIDPPTIVGRNMAHVVALILAADGHVTAPDLVPVSLDVLRDRVPEPADRRGTGEPSPWPTEAQMSAARCDEELLRRLLEGRWPGRE